MKVPNAFCGPLDRFRLRPPASVWRETATLSNAMSQEKT